MKFWIYILFTYLELKISHAFDSDQLLFTTQNGIFFKEIVGESKSIEIAGSLSQVSDVTFDYETHMLFFISQEKKIISLSLITKQRQVIVESQEEYINHIAVDWVTKKLYFTTSTHSHRLEVCSFDGSDRSVLLSSHDLKPHGLFLVPQKGYLFFTEYAGDVPLMIINMDGSQLTQFSLSDFTIVPTALVKHNSVYWIKFSDNFNKCTLKFAPLDDLSNRQVVLTESEHFVNVAMMAITDSHIFFLNRQDILETSMTLCDFSNRTISNCSDISNGSIDFTSLKLYGNETQPFVNSGCHVRNGGCSHLCLLRPEGHTCACKTGYRLLPDNLTCSDSMDKFLLLSTSSNIQLVSLETDDNYNTYLPVGEINSGQGIDFDPIDKYVYWAEHSSNSYGSIRRAFLNGSGLETVVEIGYTYPDHIAVDWVSRNLYWTCPKFNKIYVISLRDNKRFTTVVMDTGLDEPRGIAIDPINGYMFWTDWGKTDPKVEMAHLDGTNRKTLVDTDIKWPNGITVVGDRIYWADGKTDRLEMYDVKRKQRTALKLNSTHIYDVAILGDFIYWTDWVERAIYKLDLLTEEKKITVLSETPDIMCLHVVDMRVNITNLCSYDNGGCSHLCFYKPNNTVKCACPNGYELDGKNCIPITGYLVYATEGYINTLALQDNNTASTPKLFDNKITHITSDVKSGTVFWTENAGEENSIKHVPINNSTNNIQVLQTGFHGLIGGLDLDWMSGNMYWSQVNHIEMSRANGRYRRTLLTRPNTDSIGLIALNPKRRKLYWLENMKGTSSLYEGALDGSGVRLIQSIGEKVSGLAVDTNTSYVYWVGAGSRNISGMNPEKPDSTRIVARRLSKPTGLAIFRKRLYFCERETFREGENKDNLREETVSSVVSVLKENGGEKQKFLILNKCEDLTVLHSILKDGENACEVNNGGCEHLCIPTTSLEKRECHCEEHYTLDLKDNTTCIAPSVFLLISEATIIYRVLFAQLTEVPVYIDGPPIRAGQLAYNTESRALFWLDDHQHKIFTRSHNAKQLPVDLGVATSRPSSFALDYYTNSLYWIDSLEYSINFVSVYNPKKSGVVWKRKSQVPTNLAIHPEKGLLIFVLNEVQTDGSLVSWLSSIHLDGSSLQRLRKLKSIEGVGGSAYEICIDLSQHRVYWLNKQYATIQSVSMTGTDERVHVNFNLNYSMPKVINVHDAYLYWLDEDPTTGRNKLKRVHVNNEISKDIHILERNYKRAADLLMVDLQKEKPYHPCKQNNGGCSHICYPRVSYSGVLHAKCSCPQGFLAVPKDHKNCQPCTKHEFMCVVSKRCISRWRVCDGVQDCERNDDESIQQCSKNTTLTPVVTTRRLAPVDSNITKYKAGIIVGAVLTVVMLVCVLIVCCKVNERKLRKLKKEQGAAFTTKTQQVFIQDTLSIGARSTLTSSLPLYRYITGSSDHLSDHALVPKPPVAPSVSTMMTSISRQVPNNFPPQMPRDVTMPLDVTRDYYDEIQLPAPPATPLYIPSEIDSVMAPALHMVAPVYEDDYEQQYYEEDGPYYSASSQLSGMRNHATPSLASGYFTEQNYRRLSSGGLQTRRPSWRNNNRHLYAISDHETSTPVPFLVSDATNIKLVGEELMDDSYSTYAPPPSPGTEYLSLAGDPFLDDVFCEARESREVDYLMSDGGGNTPPPSQVF